jgi:trigger factor
MKVTINQTSDTKRTLEIVGDEQDLSKLKKHTLENLRPKVSAPGFREGKAPLNVVEKSLGSERVQAEVLEEAVNHLYSETVIDKKLRPMDKPKINLKKFVPYTAIEFSAEIEVVPPVKLTDYKKIKAKRESPKIKDQDIQGVLDNLRSKTAERKPVKRAAKDGDEAVIDFSGTKDGKDVAGASGKDYRLKIGAKTFIPGFEEELIGLKAGDDKKFKITFPKDYGHKPLAGQEVEFSVSVKSVNEVGVPEMNDKWAKTVGPFDSLEMLKDDVKAQLMQQKMQESDNKLKDNVVEQLVTNSQVTVPDMLLKDQIEHMKQDFLNNLSYRGITLKEYLEQNELSEDEWTNKELKPQAERRVKIGLVLSEVAEQEGLSVSDEELNLRIQLLKNQYQDEQTKAQFDDPTQRRDVASRLLTEKTLNKLVDYAAK